MSIAPLPSLIHASASDASNMRMRRAGRKAWSRTDYNHGVDVQERLIKACYARPGDHPNMRYIRFGVAAELERRNLIGLKSKMADIHKLIDAAMA